jgi:hypothetical protein
MKKLLIFFSAGCAGGLAYSVAVSVFGDLGITSALGVSYHHSLTPGWVYPRIVWGGIWGILFFLPLSQSNLFLKGTILSLLPASFQLFVVFPLLSNHSIGGIDLGMLTPLLILFFNWLWGLATALMLQLSK